MSMNPKIVNATIGQYSDYASFSDLAWGARCYCCGQPSEWSGFEGHRLPDGSNPNLCGGCNFRHTVMKAAGREDEFWAAAGKHESHDILSNVAREMAYRLGQSIEALVAATAE